MFFRSINLKGASLSNNACPAAYVNLGKFTSLKFAALLAL